MPTLISPKQFSQLTGEPVRTKYHSRKCDLHVPAHHSFKECRRYAELVLLERAGEIRDLRQQVRVDLCNPDCEHKRHIIYVADFEYREPRPDPTPGETRPLWVRVLEDAKGMQTDVFKIKKHILEDQGMTLRLT